MKIEAHYTTQDISTFEIVLRCAVTTKIKANEYRRKKNKPEIWSPARVYLWNSRMLPYWKPGSILLGAYSFSANKLYLNPILQIDPRFRAVATKWQDPLFISKIKNEISKNSAH